MWIPWCHQLQPKVSCSRQSSDLRWKNTRTQQNELSLNHFGLAEHQFAAPAINKSPSPSSGIHRVRKCWDQQRDGAEVWSHCCCSAFITPEPSSHSSKKLLFTQKFSLSREKNCPPNCMDLTKIPHLDNSAAKPRDAAEEQHWVALENKFFSQ